jgi:hypothetical protein
MRLRLLVTGVIAVSVVSTVALVASGDAAQRARVEGRYSVTEKVVSSTAPYKPAGTVVTRTATIVPGCRKGPCSKFTAKFTGKGPYGPAVALQLYRETAPGIYESDSRGKAFSQCDDLEGALVEETVKNTVKIVASKDGIVTKARGTGQRTMDRAPCAIGHATTAVTAVKLPG